VETPVEILRRTRQEALALANEGTTRGLLRLLQRAEDDLEKRLARRKELVPFGDGSFTSQQMKVTLVQIRATIADLVKSLGPEIADHAEEAAEAASEGVADYLIVSEQRFTGINQGLAIDEAAMLDSATAGARVSVLRRLMREHPDGKGGGILQRYGYSVVQGFERQLATAVATRKPFEEVRASLVDESPFLQKAPQFWAERVARTELMGAYNRGAHESMKRVNEDVGGMLRILVATFDSRTGGDSANVHGEIRRLDEPFEYVDYDGEHTHFMTPPNRPNDREVVVVHRQGWPIPEGMRPKSDAEVEGRYRREKRPYHGRPRVMSTVKGVVAKPLPEEKRHTLESLEIEHDVEPETRKSFEGAIEKGGYGPMLQNAPLRSLRTQSSTLSDGTDAPNGAYSYDHRITILDRKDFEARYRRQTDHFERTNENRVGMGLTPIAKEVGPDIWSLSSIASSADDMQRRTSTHELGHHLHRANYDPVWVPQASDEERKLAHSIDADVHAAWKSRWLSERWMVSKYANRDHDEWFAETHAAYVFHPETLKKKDPDAYALMKKIREQRGMKP
jgi:Glucose-regulated metallo-peptidase M90